MTTFHKNDTEAQKAIRVATEELYCDIRNMVARKAGKAEIISVLKGFQPAINEMMQGVVDLAWDDVEYKQYGYNSMRNMIAAHVHAHIVVGIGGIMPIGKHIVQDWQDMVDLYSK